MRSFVRFITVGVALAAASACSSTIAPGESATSKAIAPTDFVTDSASYTMRTDDIGYHARIDATFTNTTNDTVYFVNCRGGTGVELQKRVGVDWQTVWSPVLLSCLSPAITVAPGARQRMPLEIFAGRAGTNMHPQFSTTDIPGTYRLMWNQALSTYQTESYPFGTPLPIEHRVSNTFSIKVE